jgi:predicted MFS family arabinose efflux permease
VCPTGDDIAHPHFPQQPAWNRSDWLLLGVLCLIQFCHSVDFMIMMPLGPRYLRELTITPGQFGLLVSAYAFSAFFSGLLAASLIDRFDRKRALLGLYAGFTLGTLACAVAPDYLTLLAARCLAGAFGGIIGAVVLTIVGDVFPEERQGFATGIVMSAFSVATIAGVPTGLVLADWLGTSAPFAALGGLSAVLVVLTGVLLPPLRHHLDRATGEAISAWQVLLLPAHVRAYALMTALVLGMFTIIPYLATYLAANVGLKEANLWLLYLFGGLATLVTNPVIGRLADRFGKRRVFRISAAFTLVMIVLLTNLPRLSVAAILTVTTLFMVAASGRIVPAMALINSSARPAYRGSFMSINTSVMQLAMGLASLLAGALLHQPVKDGPLEGYPLVGLLACASTALAIVLAGYVHPAEVEPSPEPPALTQDEDMEPLAEPVSGTP